MKSPIEAMAESIYSAIIRDMPAITYEHYQYQDGMRNLVEGTRRPGDQEVTTYQFPQQWSNTAIGFGGIAGHAFTMAYTTVVIYKDVACVYFGGRFAYRVNAEGELFNKHLALHRMNQVSDSIEYA